MGFGALVLALLALLPSTASAQYEVTTTSVLGTSTTNTTASTTSTTEAPTTTEAPEETSTTVRGDSVVPPKQPTPPGPDVEGDVVSRPLPRTGSELNGTAMFGAALTVAGVGLALAARKRRNAYEGS